MHLMTQAKNNVSALELKRHLGVSYPTAWMVKHKIMEVMLLREQSRQLTGRVEIDDAYLGGEHHGGKPGRGSPNKVSFVAAVQTTESGQPVLVCYSKRAFTKESIQAFADSTLLAPATLVSDGLACFAAVKGTGIHHERHVTGGGPSSVKNPDFWAVNTLLGNLKTALAGTYHAFGLAKYSHRYLAQVQYLFNRSSTCAASSDISRARPAGRNRAPSVNFEWLNNLADQKRLTSMSLNGGFLQPR